MNGTGKGFTRIRNRLARLSTMCHRGTTDRSIKSLEITDPWPFKQCPRVRSRGWSRCNILHGTGAAKAFCAERESHPKLGYLFRDRSQSRSKACRFRIHARDAVLELEPHYFARGKNRSRQHISLRAVALVAADTSSDSMVGV